MTAASQGLHEDGASLGPDVVDRHRAIVSMSEELEAVDWYDQRVNATSDGELADILGHHRDEEKEHFAMLLEWLRRRDAAFDEHLRRYLFTDGAVLAIEESADDEPPPEPPGAAHEEVGPGEGGLGVGGLKAPGAAGGDVARGGSR